MIRKILEKDAKILIYMRSSKPSHIPWLIWKLTNGRSHVTDYTNACRTQLFNIVALDWDDMLLDMFDIPRCMLPEVRCSNEIFGETDVEGLFDAPVKISGILGDSNGAFFGQNCFETGDIKVTYGTGSSVMMNVGNQPVFSDKGLLSSIAWGYNGAVHYVLDGNITCSGGTLSWLKDNINFINAFAEIEPFAKQISNNDGVYFVPAFAGLGAPYWASGARAMIYGLSTSTTKAHMIRAALESIVYQVIDELQLIIEATGNTVSELRVDGGPTNNEILMQYQADMSGVKVTRNIIEELSAIGAAYMAGLAVGIWRDFDDIRAMRQVDKVFVSKFSREERDKLYCGWKDAVRRVVPDANHIF